MLWAAKESRPGSLFVVLPVNPNWVRFRLVTRRGVYVTVHDINQLMYARTYVLESVARLAALGVTVKAPHQFDSKPYVHPTCERLTRLAGDGVDYYILPAGSAVPGGSVIPFHDDAYSVLDVRRTVSACRPEER
jgi:hypothetical protein